MNLVLLHSDDFITETRVILRGRRFQHIRQVHQAEPGESLKVGLLNDKIGQGTVIRVDNDGIELDVHLDQAPPAKLPLTLVMALPRPKMLKRIFQTCATLGVAELILINSYRVEKSYWQTPFLSEEKIREHLILGLEQGVDTLLPQIHLKKRFKPFVEDELPALAAGRRALVAHPYQAQTCPPPNQQPTLLAVGPEGGFIPYEVEKLCQAGLTPIHLGPRILRVETAIPVLAAKLFHF